MASACVNTSVAMSAEAFGAPATIPGAYGWISPRISFSRDFAADESSAAPPRSPEKPDPDGSLKDLPDFEFRLDDPVAMLPADELISNGRLLPLQAAAADRREGEIRAAEQEEAPPPPPPRMGAVLGSEAYAQSPRAPKCSSRWRELLRLKKQQSPKPEPQKPAPAPARNPNPRSIRRLLHRSPRNPALDASLSLPLLRDPDAASVSISSRFSLSSSSSSSPSSSGPDHDEHPRLSLDSEKLSQSQIQAPPRLRLSRPRSAAAPRVGRIPIRRDAAAEGDAAAPPPPRGASVDSPRLNAAGKVVFQGLERSSSSPSTFNGAPRVKHRGIERSYSANVRVAPVLNVPVCSLRGSGKGPSVFALGTLFSSSSQRREREASSSSSSASATARGGSRSKMEKDKASGH